MDQKDYFDIFKAAVNLKGKKVLEIGGSVPPSVVGRSGVRAWHSINISDNYKSDEKTPAFYNHWRMSATKMNFSDDQFDAVFSSNCFEHVSDVAAAFSEIKRVLKPGGMFFTIFGPVWSGPHGHHAWVHDENGKPVTFHDPDSKIPDWGHLLFNRSQMGDILSRHYSPFTVEKLLRYIYDSKDVNRNHDFVYDREINRQRLQPIIRHRIRNGRFLSVDTHVALRIRHEYTDDFTTTGFFWLFKKGRPSMAERFRAYSGAAWALLRAKLFRL